MEKYANFKPVTIQRGANRGKTLLSLFAPVKSLRRVKNLPHEQNGLGPLVSDHKKEWSVHNHFKRFCRVHWKSCCKNRYSGHRCGFRAFLIYFNKTFLFHFPYKKRVRRPLLKNQRRGNQKRASFPNLPAAR